MDTDVTNNFKKINHIGWNSDSLPFCFKKNLIKYLLKKQIRCKFCLLRILDNSIGLIAPNATMLDVLLVLILNLQPRGTCASYHNVIDAVILIVLRFTQNVTLGQKQIIWINVPASEVHLQERDSCYILIHSCLIYMQQFSLYWVHFKS